MKKQKLLPLMLTLLLLFSAVFSMIPQASASTVEIFYNAVENSYTKLWDTHPAEGAAPSAFGAAFTATGTGYLTTVSVYLKRYGTLEATLELQAVVNGVSGTIGVDAVPSGAFYDISTNTRTADTIGTSNGLLYTFTFLGDVLLTAGQNYTVSIQIFGTGTLTEMDNIMYVGTVPNSNTGSAYEYKNDAYTYTGAIDCSLKVEGSSTTSASTMRENLADKLHY